MKPYALILLALSVAGGIPLVAGSELTPQQIVANSIAYHDPNGVWARGEVHLNVHTIYSDKFAEQLGSKEVAVQLWLSPARESFRYSKEAGEDVVEYQLNGKLGSVTLNGSNDISDEDRQRVRVGSPAVYRNYFQYLYGMPMKLRDPGTNLDPNVKETQFNGRAVLALRVTYDPAVGEDIWYFYFDKNTFALVGYRFFHEEAKNDGEYIAFEGEVEDPATGMRLPKARAWFYNADDTHLATDEIVSLSAKVD